MFLRRLGVETEAHRGRFFWAHQKGSLPPRGGKEDEGCAHWSMKLTSKAGVFSRSIPVQLIWIPSRVAHHLRRPVAILSIADVIPVPGPGLKDVARFHLEGADEVNGKLPLTSSKNLPGEAIF